MAAEANDPTEPIRLKASQYAEVDEGTACTQSSFKTGGKGFLYTGPQGGRHKAMFKLKDSIPEATGLAGQDPDRFEVGKLGWVTARFSADEAMPRALWEIGWTRATSSAGRRRRPARRLGGKDDLATKHRMEPFVAGGRDRDLRLARAAAGVGG